MAISGRVWKYGDNIDTDAIVPARHLNISDPDQLAAHCMEDWDASFVSGVRPGDIIVAGSNFGCGSSREHAPVAIKASGISCVIAATFARIFFRNAINIGLPILECPEAAAAIEAGETVEVDLAAGTIRRVATGDVYQSTAYPPFMLDLINAGGLVEYTRRRLHAGQSDE
ncbi:MAG: 3-isopropylmalate dehydratase small subunit [Chloroflexi bacterium]|nr:3-isopropylmalate dehydratase small subunit [Chloroflexota bacterium]